MHIICSLGIYDSYMCTYRWLEVRHFLPEYDRTIAMAFLASTSSRRELYLSAEVP